MQIYVIDLHNGDRMYSLWGTCWYLSNNWRPTHLAFTRKTPTEILLFMRQIPKTHVHKGSSRNTTICLLRDTYKK